MQLDLLVRVLLVLVHLMPFLAFAILGSSWLVGRVPGERTIARVALAGTGLSAIFAIASASLALSSQVLPVSLRLAPWFGIGAYEFELSFFVDEISLTMMVLVAVLTVITAKFSVDYLHREPGFLRYFVLICLFEAAMQILISSGGYDQLFVGWEVVGICSVLLVCFFHERNTPVRASLRVLASYRACDVGLLFAIVLFHHTFHSAEYSEVLGHAAATGIPTTAIALALLLGAMGKSAQLPLGGWLPRAMEGPTPSSALFYGALSVHAGVYLLIRSAPFFDASPIARTLVIVVGAGTAIYSTILVRVQTDAKSALAHASMAQLGVMFVECGLGWHKLALIHLVGHASLRGYQLLRAPSALHDARLVQAALGDAQIARPAPSGLVAHLHRLALSRFHLEVVLDRVFIRPVIQLGRALERLERRWEALLGGAASAESAPSPSPSLEESSSVRRAMARE